MDYAAITCRAHLRALRAELATTIASPNAFTVFGGQSYVAVPVTQLVAWRSRIRMLTYRADEAERYLQQVPPDSAVGGTLALLAESWKF